MGPPILVFWGWFPYFKWPPCSAFPIPAFLFGSCQSTWHRWTCLTFSCLVCVSRWSLGLCRGWSCSVPWWRWVCEHWAHRRAVVVNLLAPWQWCPRSDGWPVGAGGVGWECLWKALLCSLTPTPCVSSVYNSDVIDKQSASRPAGNADDKAVIILVPVRLGGERTNTDYLEFVKVWNWSSFVRCCWLMWRHRSFADCVMLL